MRKATFAKSLLGLSLLTMGFAPQAHATRVMYSTINLNRSDSDAVNSALGGSTVVSVTLKNISNQNQTVTVKFADATVHAEATFADEATGKKDLPSWTEMMPAMVVRFVDITSPSQTQTASLSALAGATLTFDIFCEYTDPISCYTGDQTSYTVNGDIKGVTFQSTYSIEIDVAEDRGAVLADVTTQMRLFTTPNTPNNPNTTRSMNGGRPF